MGEMLIIVCLLVCTTSLVAPDAMKQKELRIFTLDELKTFNGENEAKPLLLAFKGAVFDVSSSPQFYGREGDYASMAGNEIGTPVGVRLLTMCANVVTFLRLFFFPASPKRSGI
jgi:predicted heme/steroid binding protein